MCIRDSPDATYRFKHSLIRDAAYQTLLKSRRKELHGLVAQNMKLLNLPADWRQRPLGAVGRLGSNTEDFPTMRYPDGEALARHWAEAGEAEPAFREWWRAGRAAEARSAFWEAQESYQQAIGLTGLLPEGLGRDLAEMHLRQSLVQMLQITTGIAGLPRAVYNRIRIARLWRGLPHEVRSLSERLK